MKVYHSEGFSYRKDSSCISIKFQTAWNDTLWCRALFENNDTNWWIYLEAQKFYDDGGFEKRANLQKAVLGSLATGKNAGEMPKDFAIAYRVFELTFVKHLNKKFKCPNN